MGEGSGLTNPSERICRFISGYPASPFEVEAENLTPSVAPPLNVFRAHVLHIGRVCTNMQGVCKKKLNFLQKVRFWLQTGGVVLHFFLSADQSVVAHEIAHPRAGGGFFAVNRVKGEKAIGFPVVPYHLDSVLGVGRTDQIGDTELWDY